MKPGSVGTAVPGHLQDSGNKPVRDSSNECWNLGYSVGPDHPKGNPGDCVVQPPPPPPAPIPVPPPPIERKVQQKTTLAADALFDFDKAVLKPEGKAAIDDAVSKFGNVRIDSITATGHTDGIGTDAYNDKLGLRRAQAVKDYMVSKGIPADKIQVDSKGKRQPVADNKTKEGRAKNRRVEIEFNGTETVTQTVPG
jgi:OOP family OmpA-OmpF porin